MKQVGIIFANAENPKAMEFVKQNLEEVFQGQIHFKLYYLDELERIAPLMEDDAYLVASEVPFQSFRHYISDYTKMIKISRCLKSGTLEELTQIPSGSSVLVVNDSYDTALETIEAFPEAGINHITMIPYDRSMEYTGIYRKYTIAVTPGEPHLVPPYIKKVIDIGYRKVDFQTMYMLMKQLNLELDVVNQNLVRYMRSITTCNTSLQDNYLYSYLKSEMLDLIVNKEKKAMVLIDSQCRTVYANKKAFSVFRVVSLDELDLRQYLDLETMGKGGTSEYMLTIFDHIYDCVQYTFSVMNETVACCIMLQDEADRAEETHQNRENGFFARHQFDDIIHRDPVMDEIIAKARKIASTDYTVLIQGESGTGKELLAQSIHNASDRRRAPFVAINCASLSEGLLESELFGYEPGAFTNAHRKGKVGLFEQANHGTIFLDEIGDISLNVQTHLLRVIQEKQIMKIGGNRLIDIDVRLITATNKDLELAVKNGEFRNDLFYRLNVLPFVMPPLRDRREDVPALTQHYLGTSYRNLTEEEQNLLREHDWPGNVRELENVSIYYRTFSVLPEYLYRYKEGSAGEGLLSVPDTERSLLRIIDAHTSLSHGIGRTSLIHELRMQGMEISDGKMRTLLSSLEEQGMVEIGKGRSGTRITRQGRLYLQTDSAGNRESAEEERKGKGKA